MQTANMLSNIKQFNSKELVGSKTKLLFVFLLVSVFLRFFSFFPSVLDHDESTYLLIGRDILNGKLLYTDVTDTKPVGIFLIYAALHWLFGYSIFLKRLAIACLVGLTAWLVHRASYKLFANQRAAFASGLIYLFYTSIWNYHGLSPNAELFFNLGTIACLLLCLYRTRLNLFLAGLVMGAGFMVKYLVLFDYVAFMLFFLVWDLKKEGFRWKTLWTYMFSGIGMLIPFIATNLFFYFAGNYDDFAFITYKMPGLYKESPSVLRYLKMLGDLAGRFFPITFFFFYVFLARKTLLEKWQRHFFLFWFVAVLGAMYLPGKEFSHYTIQLMLPVSLVAGLFFHQNAALDRFSQRIFSGKTGLILLCTILVAIQVNGIVSVSTKADQYKEVAHYLKPKIQNNEKVFVSDYEQIVYYLLKLESPTPYVHSTILFSPLHKAFAIDPQKEIKRIVDQKPKYVVARMNNTLFEEIIADQYQLDTIMVRKKESHSVKIFERIDGL